VGLSLRGFYLLSLQCKPDGHSPQVITAGSYALCELSAYLPTMLVKSFPSRGQPHRDIEAHSKYFGMGVGERERERGCLFKQFDARAPRRIGCDAR
jgi:hypothetical protein